MHALIRQYFYVILGRMPRIAVLILSYNNAPDTLNCVTSVQRSAYPDFDIFIIDNHSPDGAYARLQAALAGAPHIYLCETGRNLGYAGGMNFGGQKARAAGSYHYFLFLNNDTLLDRDCLAGLAHQAQALGDHNIYAPIAYFMNTRIVFCGGMASYIPGPFQLQYLGWPFLPRRRPYRSPYLSGACFLVSTGLFERAGGFDETLFLYGEDVLFGETVRRLGGQVIMAPSALFWHSGSKAGGYVSVTKAYYLSRNLPRLARLISSDHLIYKLRIYVYLLTKGLLALASFNLPVVRAVFKGLRDDRQGITGPLAPERPAHH